MYRIFSLWILIFSVAHASASDKGWIKPFENWSPEQGPGELVFGEQYSIKRTGGEFWYFQHFEIDDSNDATWIAIDFRNSSVIGLFTHYLYDEENNLLSTSNGGISSTELNYFFLRHGRPVELEPGNYQLVTKLDSPFYLAKPEPVIFPLMEYLRVIKIGNAITMIGLGIFISLGIYYLTLSISRSRRADIFYATFILGNFFYNGSALLFFSDVLGIKWFYGISAPILISNIAYVWFVVSLLSINRNHHKYLFGLAQALTALFIGFIFASLMAPHLSLEFDRIGVGLFSIYGLICGIVCALKKNIIAKYYLVANIGFIIPGIISISLTSINSTLYIEHIGMIAVAIEVILLALVLTKQMGLVYKEKAAALLSAEAALEAAEQAAEVKDRFLANMSHEIRTPINGIVGASELLKEEINDPQSLEHINTVSQSSEYLLTLVNEVLDISKINAGQMKLESTTTELTELISTTADMFSLNAEKKSLQFNVYQDSTVPDRISADAFRLQQIITNLLSNALKFTEQGSVELRVSCSSNVLTFNVVDTGIGISEEKLSEIFTAFTQADSSITRKYGGTGLGLHISHSLAQMMGGSLRAESKLGRGTCMTLILPVEEQSMEQFQNRTLTVKVAGDKTAQSIRYQTPDKHIQFVDEDSQQNEDLCLVFHGSDHSFSQYKTSGTASKVIHWINHQDKASLSNQNLKIQYYPFTRHKLYNQIKSLNAHSTPNENETPLPLAGKKVTAVDDNQVNLKIVSSMLKKMGAEVKTFLDPVEAVPNIFDDKPHCVIMDMQMPIMDGPQATRELRKLGFTAPIIAYTANSTEKDRQLCVEAGMDDFLVKPVKKESLRKTINKWVD